MFKGKQGLVLAAVGGLVVVVVVVVFAMPGDQGSTTRSQSSARAQTSTDDQPVAPTQVAKRRTVRGNDTADTQALAVSEDSRTVDADRRAQNKPEKKKDRPKRTRRTRRPSSSDDPDDDADRRESDEPNKKHGVKSHRGPALRGG